MYYHRQAAAAMVLHLIYPLDHLAELHRLKQISNSLLHSYENIYTDDHLLSTILYTELPMPVQAGVLYAANFSNKRTNLPNGKNPSLLLLTRLLLPSEKARSPKREHSPPLSYLCPKEAWISATSSFSLSCCQPE